MKTEETKSNQVWDVIVIGGGPAGMMAAATAAAAGAAVLLIEKNTILGKKLSITGGGRCNITNNKPLVRDMLAAYKSEGKFLFSTFTQHSVADSLAWFLERGVPMKEENEGRLFPVSESAAEVRDVMVTELKQQGVTIRSGESVQRLTYDQVADHFSIETTKDTHFARSCIVATGGYARPDTGSTGDGFAWLEDLGHTIKPVDDALVPVRLASPWIKKLSGTTLPQVTVSVWSEGKKQQSKSGRLLFTHFGVTGPLILNMSKSIADLLHVGPVELRLDVFPQYDAGACKEYLKVLLQSNKKLQNALVDALPLQLVKGILAELVIDGDTPCHSVRKEDRARLLQYVKSIALPVDGLLGVEKSIVSSGGVVQTEIDPRTMSSAIVPNLYLVGDV